MNHNEFVQALKAGKVSGAYLFEGVEENIKSVTLAALRKAVLADGLAELNESVMENPSRQGRLLRRVKRCRSRRTSGWLLCGN